MKDAILKSLISIPLILLAVFPPFQFNIFIFNNTLLWHILVLSSAFLAFYLCTLKVNLPVKLLVAYSFINCLFSQAPYIAFTAFISLIFCAYFYYACTQIRDWDFMEGIIKSILLINLVLLISSFYGHDTLLNFGRIAPVNYGTIGNKMQLGTFAIVLGLFLLSKSLKYLIPIAAIAVMVKSNGAILALLAFGTVYLFLKAKDIKTKALVILTPAVVVAYMVMFSVIKWGKYTLISAFFYARWPVWVKAIKLTLAHPFLGYGIGTFKSIFPGLQQIGILTTKPGYNYVAVSGSKETWGLEGYWFTAHSSYIQWFFEMGGIGELLILALLIYLIKLFLSVKDVTQYRIKPQLLFASLIMLLTVKMVHFPDRMIQGPLILSAFLAYYERQMKLVQEWKER
jgi:O-antigen ligase